MQRECIEASVPPPDLKRGDVVYDGIFYRNLRNEDMRRRYSNDESSPPQYGSLIQLHKLRGWDRHPYDLSVNISSCTSLLCSIWLHPVPHIFRHIARIDIAELSNALKFTICASYDPIFADQEDEDSELINPCHFLLGPEEGSFNVFTSELRSIVWDGFPSEERKIPREQELRQQALGAIQEFEKAILVIYDVNDGV